MEVNPRWCLPTVQDQALRPEKCLAASFTSCIQLTGLSFFAFFANSESCRGVEAFKTTTIPDRQLAVTTPLRALARVVTC